MHAVLSGGRHGCKVRYLYAHLSFHKVGKDRKHPPMQFKLSGTCIEYSIYVTFGW